MNFPTMKIPTALSRTVGRNMLIGKMNSPKLLFAGGIIGMVGSTVLACRATLKMTELLDVVEKDLAMTKTLSHRRVEYTEKDRGQDVAIIYGRSVVAVAKLYTPAVVVGVVSVAALTKSHRILEDRNVALTAAYVAVSEAFDEYRDRVRAKYGEDQDREFRYASEEVEFINDKGKTIKELRAAPGKPSMYARFFDETSRNWQREYEYNFPFLRCQQSMWNDQLVSKGHVFLNEVYDALDIARTMEGQLVGWVLGPDSDNYIDFGIFDPHDGRARDFNNGREGAILLDFNVDGVIYDKLDYPKRGPIVQPKTRLLPWKR